MLASNRHDFQSQVHRSLEVWKEIPVSLNKPVISTSCSSLSFSELNDRLLPQFNKGAGVKFRLLFRCKGVTCCHLYVSRPKNEWRCGGDRTDMEEQRCSCPWGRTGGGWIGCIAWLRASGHPVGWGGWRDVWRGLVDGTSGRDWSSWSLWWDFCGAPKRRWRGAGVIYQFGIGMTVCYQWWHPVLTWGRGNWGWRGRNCGL